MTASRYLLYRDGQVHPASGPVLVAAERGYLFGDGVFETLRTAGGCPVLLAAHLARLRAGAGVLGLSVPASDGELEGAIAAAIAPSLAGGEEAVVRLTLSRGPARERGLLPGAAGPPTVMLQVTPLPRPVARPGGLRLAVAEVRRNEGSPLSRIKSLNYLDNVLARREAEAAGADDALMLNNRGEVACASASNVFWTAPLDDEGQVCLVTPPTSCGVLAGITRGTVLALASDAGLPCREQAVTLPWLLHDAREVFVTNSVTGVQPVASLAGRELPTAGPLSHARRLAALYAALLHLPDV